MFSFFKSNPIEKLQKKHNAKLKEAMDMQRSGDVLKAGFLYNEAEEIAKQIEKLTKESQSQ